MDAKKLLVTVALVTTIAVSIGLLAAAVSTGNRDAVAMDRTAPVQVDVAPVVVKRIRHWDEFNGRISAVEL